MGPSFLTPVSGEIRQGTLCWMAPETILGGSLLSISSDIYALGIIMWELATCQAPFEGLPQDILIGRLSRGDRPKIPKHPTPGFPTAYFELLQRCWSQNPELRPCASDVQLALSSMSPEAKVAAEAKAMAIEGELLKKNKLLGWSSRYFTISKTSRSLTVYKDATKSDVSVDALVAAATASANALQVTADIVFSPATTIEPVESSKILLSQVHDGKKGAGKDSYLLDASCSVTRERWITSFRCSDNDVIAVCADARAGRFISWRARLLLQPRLKLKPRLLLKPRLKLKPRLLLK
jgi:serine/threonine protein kinase